MDIFTIIFLPNLTTLVYSWALYPFYTVVGIEGRASCLLGKYSTTWATPSALLIIACYSDRISWFCLDVHDPPTTALWVAGIIGINLHAWHYFVQAIVNVIIFLISFWVSSLMVYIKRLFILVYWFLYFATLLNLYIKCKGFLVESLKCFKFRIISSVNRDNLTSSFPICIHLFIYSLYC
jgi:hypothetical protein